MHAPSQNHPQSSSISSHLWRFRAIEFIARWNFDSADPPGSNCFECLSAPTRMRLGRSSEIGARERRVECSASRRLQYQEIDHGSDCRNALGVMRSFVCADDFWLFLRFEPAQICSVHDSAGPSAIWIANRSKVSGVGCTSTATLRTHGAAA